MIYTVVVLVIVALLIALTIAGEKKKGLSKFFFYTNISLFILGVGLFVSALIIANNQINSLDIESEFYSWVKDSWDIYCDLSVAPFISLLVVNLMASILGIFVPKYQTPISLVLRKTVSIFSSVLFLLLPYYGYITLNDTIPLLTFMIIAGIGQSLVIRLASAVDMTNQIRNNRGKTL